MANLDKQVERKTGGGESENKNKNKNTPRFLLWRARTPRAYDTSNLMKNKQSGRREDGEKAQR